MIMTSNRLEKPPMPPTKGGFSFMTELTKLDKILNIGWGYKKIYGLGISAKGAHAYWTIPDHVQEQVKIELKKLVIELIKSESEAFNMQDAIGQTAITDYANELITKVEIL